MLTLLVLFVLVLGVVKEGEHGVGEVKGGRQQYQVSHDQADLKF